MRVLYLVATALTLVATPALAGGCCGGIYGPAPIFSRGYVLPPPDDQSAQIYIVNQGPVLEGPGIYTYTNPWLPSFAPPGYAPPRYFPYVRRSARRWCPGCGGFASFEPPMYWRAGWRARRHR